MKPNRAKPVLALIHGWGLGRWTWDTVVPALSGHCRVILVDLPGYGAAPPDPRAFSETARRIVAELPAGVVLCGWSLGALLALDAAAGCRERIAGLALVGATPCFRQREAWPHAQPAALLERFRASVDAAPAETLRRFVALLNQGDAQARAHVRAQHRAQHRALLDGLPDTASLRQGLAWLDSVDLRPASPTISMPTLLIHGERDPLMPLAAARWLTAEMPQARLEIFAGAAHAPFLGAPERFAQLLIDHCHACNAS